MVRVMPTYIEGSAILLSFVSAPPTPPPNADVLVVLFIARNRRRGYGRVWDCIEMVFQNGVLLVLRIVRHNARLRVRDMCCSEADRFDFVRKCQSIPSDTKSMFIMFHILCDTISKILFSRIRNMFGKYLDVVSISGHCVKICIHMNVPYKKPTAK